MKRKIAIRKLNRTLLKKEGTKEVYITGKNVLMPFFGYDRIEDLATSRKDDESKKKFLCKKRLQESKRTEMILSVTKENNEVRLTGFEDFFASNGVKEVDQIILECRENDGVKEFFLDFEKNLCNRVFQSYSTKDSLENYKIKKSEKGTIQFEELVNPIEKHSGTYWLWDDDFDEGRWNEIVGQVIEITFVSKGNVFKKQIQIIKTGENITKLLKAQSNASNCVEYQKKELYRILEYIGGEWFDAGFNGIKNLELTDEEGRIKIANRDAMSFCLFEGGVVG